MDTNNNSARLTQKEYEKQRLDYYKVIIGLLLLTALTFVQPHLFAEGSTFLAQMFIALAKAWLIVIYYMHLKGDKLIGYMVLFSLFLVAVFFIIIIGIDAPSFQYGAESYITAPASAH